MPQHLTYSQIAALKRRNIIVRIEFQNKTVLCWDRGHERYYTAGELKQLAKPGFMDRFTAWIGGAA